jgi:hypothetical protein
VTRSRFGASGAEKLCARVALPAWSCGPSTSPLGGMSLLDDLRGDTPLEVRRRRFFRFGATTSWFFCLVGAFGAVRTFRAAYSGERWTNYQGLPIGRSDLEHTARLFLAVALCSAIVGILMSRAWLKAR